MKLYYLWYIAQTILASFSGSLRGRETFLFWAAGSDVEIAEHLANQRTKHLVQSSSVGTLCTFLWGLLLGQIANFDTQRRITFITLRAQYGFIVRWLTIFN